MKFSPLYPYSPAALWKHDAVFSIRLSMMSGKRSSTGDATSRSASSFITSCRSIFTLSLHGDTYTFPSSLMPKYDVPHPLML